MDRAGNTVLKSISWEKEVLQAMDEYIKKLHDRKIHTNRSAIVNTAILYYLSGMADKENRNE